MFAIRRPLRLKFAINSSRTFATASTPYVPPASLEIVADAPPPQFRSRKKTKPESPSFYTSRASYYDHLYQLETALQRCRRAISTLELLPLPAFARASLPPAQLLWRNRQSMMTMFSGSLTTARYRRMISVLADLEECSRIASAAGHTALAESIQPVLELFERQDKETVLARTVRKQVPMDRYGRSYTVGKRKESAARVWMIPVREPAPVTLSSDVLPSHSPRAQDVDILAPVVDNAFAPSPSASRMPVTTTTILVNNIPLNKYFDSPADRERIVRPLKLAGVLGTFNAFVIVRGGGTTGQAGAIAHGIAQGIVAHVPEVDHILRKAKLIKRDPRMVERKKTGLAKARKRYTWVKR
ncbi:ribosomal protein S9/S16-domain-containing protein [Multifurca ochricompacta]|uniref:Ribosomal protein S9/S16-domain-containing protein n=1 Tax=Multifurca ochricompacta TaxID=376703 RepID=A0AAD4QN43_9AGAM|nr:ribosomal protein S9/S16-domain-containing protein [Multifurca ochricompacta]